MSFKKGDNVEIYKDPLTKKQFEAYAVLVQRVSGDSSFDPDVVIERWLVRFDGGFKDERTLTYNNNEGQF